MVHSTRILLAIRRNAATGSNCLSLPVTSIVPLSHMAPRSSDTYMGILSCSSFAVVRLPAGLNDLCSGSPGQYAGAVRFASHGADVVGGKRAVALKVADYA